MAKLNAMLDELRRREHVQNRQLAAWLKEDEYESFENHRESQQKIKEGLKDKPGELKRYENKLHQLTSSNSLYIKQVNPLQTTQFEPLSNPSLLKNCYPI
ncbi:hypothetical protein N9Q79_01535 [Alphaproteobacteria bacterium]|nr:hypothetical protein [Alphaproteobacteria bacterium]